MHNFLSKAFDIRFHFLIRFATISLIFIALAIDCWASPPDLTQPLPTRLRAGYMSASNIDLLPQMAQAGMNAAIPKFDLKAPLTDDVVAKLCRWAEKANEYNLAFMPVINWWGASHVKYLPGYSPVVTDSGTVLVNTPCPYTEAFWEKWVIPRMASLAESIGNRPIGALLIDMEMYGVEYTEYTRGCYCDECFSRYMKAKGFKGSLPKPSDRNDFVKKLGDLALYESLQREASRALAVECRNILHRVNPGLRLGALNLDSDIPLQQGIVLGFGTQQMPVYCLTEKTYSTGFSPYITIVQQYFKQIGANVDLLVGIWQSKFPSENISEQLYHCAHESYGYWIYTMETFASLDYHPLPGKPEEFWIAIQRANKEMGKLELNQNYKTDLKIRPFEAPTEPLPWKGFVRYNLVQYETKASNLIPMARLRGTNWVYFYAKKGEPIQFEIAWQRVANNTDPVRVGLVSPDGTPLTDYTVKRGKPLLVTAVAPINGVYGLVVMSVNGTNSADITKASHPYAVHIGSIKGAGFVDKLPPVFVSVVPNSKYVEFLFVTENNAEAVKGAVLALDGSQLWSGIIDGATRVHIDNPGIGLLQIRFDKLPGHVFEDVWVKGLKGVLPFVSTDPTGLLKQ